MWEHFFLQKRGRGVGQTSFPHKKREENAGQASLPFFLFLFSFLSVNHLCSYNLLVADFPQINHGSKCEEWSAQHLEHKMQYQGILRRVQKTLVTTTNHKTLTIRNTKRYLAGILFGIIKHYLAGILLGTIEVPPSITLDPDS